MTRLRASSSPLLLLVPLLPLLLLLLGGGARAGRSGVVLASGFANPPSSTTTTLHRRSSAIVVDDDDVVSITPRGGGGGGGGYASSSKSTTTITTTTTTTACLGSSSSVEEAATPSSSSSSSSPTTTATTSSKFDVVSPPNWNLLGPRGRLALERLVSHDIEHGGSGSAAQVHVYGDWPAIGIEDDGKIALAEQIADLDESYPGGLPAYLTKAKRLLAESSSGANPFAEYEASVPDGESLSYYDTSVDDGDYDESRMTFPMAENVGLSGIGSTAFVLVAGGLGERLGYSGIKLGLETNLLTNRCYLEVYCRYILAMQRMARNRLRDGGIADENAISAVRIPLAIMTSDDTDPLTRKLLSDNDDFGFESGQITIIKQDKVAALTSVDASLSMKSRWEVETKPHGHGDVHHLLHKSGLVGRWSTPDEFGHRVNHVIFLQDTNALVINSILPTLGVSIAKGYHMNSICIPRLAGEAAGAIARLEHKTDPEKSLVINVEYNQLDPLLSSQGDRKGDVPDPKTGYSPYPGNANNIVIEMNAYAKTLGGEDQGVVVEFVNPKYKDDKVRTEFKKPTRLECMMQDIPKLFQKEMGSEARIGFTMFDRWFTFSPAKNSLDAGVDDVKKGGKAPGTMSSAESDKYIQNQRKLRHAGVDIRITTDDELVSVAGIPVTPGPRVILCPGFAITQREILEKIDEGNVISDRSSLVLEGEGLRVKNLDLDGALVIRTGHDCDVTVDGLIVRNRGYELAEVADGEDVPEEVAIRGYTMRKHEVMEIIINEPGRYVVGPDGEVKRVEE